MARSRLADVAVVLALSAEVGRTLEPAALPLATPEPKRAEQVTEKRTDSGSGDGHGIETRGDFSNAPAAPWIAPECVTRDIEERLGKRVGDDWVGLISGLQDRYALRECFDQGDAERPDVGGRRER